MELETFWEQVFSENASHVLAAWSGLRAEERAAVHDLLARIAIDGERSEGQRAAARFALATLAAVHTPGPGASGAWLEDTLVFARDQAARTARQLKNGSGHAAASLKRDGTVLTESDIESDRRLGAAIRARYPEHGVLSEESDLVFRGHEWCWVIDPIDGTTNYARGFPIWGVLMALLHRGQPVLGVADFPMLGEQYWAARGRGAWLNGEPIRAATLDRDENGRPRPEKTHLFACCTRTLRFGAPAVPMKVRVPGNTGYDLAMIAKGTCIGSLDMAVHVWDVAALWPITHEAGAILMSESVDDVFPLREGTNYGAVQFSLLAACCADFQPLLLSMLSDRFPQPPVNH
jgi:myo-inositol-1(or 4)-monophosphatase